mgnify:CR=1 FL=1
MRLASVDDMLSGKESRYALVIGVAKRAREIIDGSMPLVDAKMGEKPLSIAIDEMNQGKMTIIAQDEEEEE